MTRLSGVLAAATVAAVLPVAAPAHAALGPKWTFVPDVPEPLGAAGAELRDVTVIGPGDVWTVGAWWAASSHPLVAHWDGAGWQVAATPDASSGAQQYDVRAVTATGPADVWAVGSIRSGTPSPPFTATLVMHYDGAAWSTVPSPSRAGLGATSVLEDVDMVSATDGWAVGRASSGADLPQAFILRWQAGRWVEAGPKLGASSGTLTSVHARSASDVWAVGSQVRADGKTASLVMHWNGAGWTQVAVPDAGGAAASETLSGVAALPGGDVWAVGRICETSGGLPVCKPLALRLVGQAWTVVPTSGSAAVLNQVVPFSATDVWAVGYASLTAQRESDHVERWDGVQFVTDSSLPPPPGDPDTNGQPASALNGAAADPNTGDMWVVGWARDPNRGSTHAAHRG